LRQYGDEPHKKAVADICADCLTLLDNTLIPSSNDAESEIFYTKIKGDFHRYLSEVRPSPQEINAARAAYQKAFDMATKNLEVTNPLRLNIALNWGVFEYEIVQDKNTGFNISKKAFDDAVPNVQQLPEEKFRESAFVLELLRENIVMWAQQMGIELGAPPGAQ